jgi:hypothetical protein
VAKIRNITGDSRSLFRADAPPIHPADCDCEIDNCNDVTVADSTVIGRAWPKSTWDFVEAPENTVLDESVEDAWLYVPAPEPVEELEEPEDPDVEPYDPTSHTVDEVVAVLQDADADERARIIAAEAAGKARKGITEWSE